MGLYFDLLAVAPGEIYERRGCVQRIAGIHPRWFRHPDAVRVPKDVFSVFRGAFQAANPQFHYYGPTEYDGSGIIRLLRELETHSFPGPVPGGSGETGQALGRILELGRRALGAGESLLVLGI